MRSPPGTQTRPAEKLFKNPRTPIDRYFFPLLFVENSHPIGLDAEPVLEGQWSSPPASVSLHLPPFSPSGGVVDGIDDMDVMDGLGTASGPWLDATVAAFLRRSAAVAGFPPSHCVLRWTGQTVLLLLPGVEGSHCLLYSL